MLSADDPGARTVAASWPTHAMENETSESHPVSVSALQPADTASPLMGDFRQFVSSERERLERKKAALAKKEKDSKLADLKSWADNFKLKTPMPADVASVIHRDPKAVTTSTASDKPRDPSLQKSLSPTAAHMASASTRAAGDKGVEMSASTGSVGGSGRAAGGTASVHPSPSGGSGAAATTGAKVGPRFAETKAMLANMTIPKIPPFNPERAKARQAAAAAAAAGSSAALPVVSTEVKAPAAPANGVVSSASSFKLSAKASAFKPFNPNAAAFTPGAAAAKKPEVREKSPSVSKLIAYPRVYFAFHSLAHQHQPRPRQHLLRCPHRHRHQQRLQ